jgi:hypothetical protein
MAFKIRNWPEYEAGLRRRGSLTLWIQDGARDHWQTVGPEGQARYTEAAIQTTLMVRTAFKLAFRQTEGLMASVITLMDLTLSAPDHTTMSRRAVGLAVIDPASVPHGPLHLLIDSTGLKVYGAGQWLEAKHGEKSRRKWRKLHLAVDAANGKIVAHTLTDQDIDMALVHFLSCERNDPGPIPLCDDPCPADGMRAPGLEHPVQHRDADDRLGLLSVETACS